MWRSFFVVVLVLAACSSKKTAPDKHLYFVPDRITQQIGSTKTLAAVDVRALKVDPLLRLIPDEAACVRDLAKMLGVVVIADGSPFTLYASHLSEIQTKDCLDRTAPLFGGKTSRGADGTYQVAAGDTVLALGWSDGIMTAMPVGAPRSAGPADQQMVDMAATIPPNVFGFLLMKSAADQRVKNIVVTMSLEGSAFDVVARGEGRTAADAQDFFKQFLAGFKRASLFQQEPFDDAWVTQRLEGTTAILEAKIPVAVFVPRKPPSANQDVEAISVTEGDGAAAAASATRYVHAIAAQDFKAVCSTRAKDEQARMAKIAGSCEAGFRAVMKDRPVTVFSTLEAKQARRRGTRIAVDLVQPGQAEPAVTLITTREADQWVLIDVADEEHF